MNPRLTALCLVLVPGLFALQPAAAWAQPAPDDDEDLEVPASPAPAPKTDTVPGPAPAPAPADVENKPAPPTPAPPPEGAEATEAPSTEAAAEAAPEAESTKEAAPSAVATGETPSTNLEKVTYGRPVPKALTIGGYIQAQYEHNDLSEDQLDPNGAPLNADRFLVRRARLRLDRGWDYAAGTLELDANTVRGPRVGIRRAEGALLYRGDNPDNAPPLVMLSVGVTDLPFGFELAESARVRAFMERSLASTALFPTEMDAGAKLSGAVGFVRYGVAISNGEPVEENELPRDPNSAKDITGRAGVDLEVAPQFRLLGGASFAVGKGFHPGTEATKGGVVWRDLDEDRVVDANEIFGTPPVAETPSENFDRWAFGLDLGVSFETALGTSRLYGELYVGQNYDRSFLPSDPVTGGVDVRQAGGYAALVQDITEYGFAGFRYAVYDPNSDLIEGRADEFYPKTQTVTTYSLLIGAELKDRAKLSFEYDFVHDYLARDALGVPSDADNDQWTLRLQVDL